MTSVPRSALQGISFQGIALSDYHRQLADLLGRRLGEEYAALFAEPVINEADNTVDWYAGRSGAVRPALKMDESERAALAAKCRERLDAVRGLADSLSSSGDAASRMRGGIVSSALRLPQDDLVSCLYEVGGEPMLICWGFSGTGLSAVRRTDIERNSAAAAPSQPLSVVETQPKPVQSVVPPAPKAPLRQPAMQAAAEAGTAKAVPEKETERTVRFAGWRVWWIPLSRFLPWLLGFLLLLLLLWLLWYYFKPVSVPVAPAPGPQISENAEPRKAVPEAEKADTEKPAEATAPKQESDAASFPEDAFRGEMRCDAGLLDEKDKPVALAVKFYRQEGRALALIYGAAQTCTGEAEADLPVNGGAQIRVGRVHCPNGNDFTGFSMSCPTRGRTVCTGRTEDGQTWSIPAEFSPGL